MQTFQGQRYEIASYCKNHGLTVDRWVKEQVSGMKDISKRTLGQMIDKMERGDLLLCTELSRLGRNMLMVMSILNDCGSRGIAVHTIKDNFDLSDSINSKIIAFAFSLAAEIERLLISQRTKEALAARKSMGIRLGRPPGRSSKKDRVMRELETIELQIVSGVSKNRIAAGYGIHRNTLCRYLATGSSKKKLL